jgi:protein-L-isoaspartate(D-aspartate) O-methyltransferase
MKKGPHFPDYFMVALLLIGITTGCRSSQTILEPETQPTSPTETGLEEASDPWLAERENMVEEQILGRGVDDPSVLAAMETVPRHEFVPDDYLSMSYADHPLPIGYGQTISQPYIVALMTENLELSPGDRVLEIGTGSGYQAAILAELDAQVYTIEIIPELAQAAEKRLSALGYANIKVLNADGYYGWEDEAPFDAVIVTAAPDHLPQPLIQQLAEGGRLIIPIGPIGAVQTLWLFESSGGELTALNLGLVSFVPLTGEH